MSRKKIGQNLVQVSTYLPLAEKMRLEVIAEKQGKTLYSLVREVVKDYLSLYPEVKKEESNDGEGENLL